MNTSLLHVFPQYSIKITRTTKKNTNIIITSNENRFEDITIELKTKDMEKFLHVVRFIHESLSNPGTVGATELKILFGKHSPIFLACHYLLSRSSILASENTSQQQLKALYLKILGHALILGQFNQASHDLNSEMLATNQKLSRLMKKFLPWNELLEWLKDKNVKICIETFMLPIMIKLILKKEDVFLELHQDLFEAEERASKGAFFTPPVLAERMVKECIKEDDVVLDPACGTGIFLISILNELVNFIKDKTVLSKRVAAFIQHHLYGLDIDELAVFLTRINLLLWLKDFPSILAHLSHFNVHQADALFPTGDIKHTFYRKFTACIGNPPWLVLNVVDDEHGKNKLKEFAKTVGLLPAPHLVTQLEISVLFLEKMKQHYLKPGGKIAFILNKAVLESNNHSRTRQFNELVNLKAWLFDSVMFRLPHACLFAEYRPNFTRSYEQLKELEIPITFFEVAKAKEGTINELQLIKRETIVHQPINVMKAKSTTRARHHATSYLVGKFLPKKTIDNLLPRGKNVYRDLCRNGASLFPRNLITIEILDRKHVNGMMIVSFRHVIERPRKPWDFDPLEKLNMKIARVESKYVYQVARSREIVPFALLDTISAFLPIEPNEKTGGYQLTTDKKSLGWQYFTKIDKLYREHVKKGASVTDLWQYLNYQGKLTTPLQRKRLRVVFAASGNKVKGFLLKDPSVIVDFKCYHFPVTSEDEGYYLLGILHAPIVSKDVITRSGERVYHKRPLDYPIPTFDPHNELHQKIFQHARHVEAKVLSIVHQWKLENLKNTKWQPITIQRLIRTRMKADFSLFDEFVKNLLFK